LITDYKGAGDFVHSIVGTANPLDKDGSRPAFIEEARCHLEVSLLVEYKGLDSDDREQFENRVNVQLQRHESCWGDVLSAKSVELLTVDEDNDQDIKQALAKLMLGHVLIERRDLMINAMGEGKDALDALLDHLKIMHRATQDDEGKVTWTSSRKTSGWLVPIATGFQGISDLGTPKINVTPRHHTAVAESMVTLGELSYRIASKTWTTCSGISCLY